MVVLFLGPKQGFLHFAVWSVSSNKQTESLCSMAPTDGKLKVLVLIVWQANVSTNIPCLSPKVGRIEGSQSLHSKNFSVPHQNLYWISIYSLTRCSYVTMATWDSQSIVPGPIASASLGNLLSMQILGPYPRPTDSETLVVEPRNLYFKESLDDPGTL